VDTSFSLPLSTPDKSRGFPASDVTADAAGEQGLDTVEGVQSARDGDEEAQAWMIHWPDDEGGVEQQSSHNGTVSRPCASTWLAVFSFSWTVFIDSIAAPMPPWCAILLQDLWVTVPGQEAGLVDSLIARSDGMHPSPSRCGTNHKFLMILSQNHQGLEPLS
jgi:hypothetical protein